MEKCFRFLVLQFSELEVEAEAKGRVVVYASSPTLNMNDLSYSSGPCQIFAFTAGCFSAFGTAASQP